MFDNLNYSKYLYFSTFFIILVELLIPFKTNGQERFFLSENDINGYELRRQSEHIWKIGDSDDQIHKAMKQKWHLIGSEKNHNIYISYAMFSSNIKAIQKTSYAANSNAWHYIWGFFNGSILGDGTWISIRNGALYFVRGNIGIQIFKPGPFTENDRQTFISIATKILNKIKLNLSPEIVSSEEILKNKKFSMADYSSIIDPIMNSSRMSKYTLCSTFSSKWLLNPENLIKGIRKEWNNEQGSVIGIDINKFVSESDALKAGENQSRIFYSEVYKLDNLNLLKNALEIRQKYLENDRLKKNISIVGIYGTTAVHIYQYNPNGVNTSSFYSIVEKLSKRITIE